jgi:hypothetical protein
MRKEKNYRLGELSKKSGMIDESDEMWSGAEDKTDLYEPSSVVLELEDEDVFEEDPDLDEKKCAFLSDAIHKKNMTLRYRCAGRVQFRLEQYTYTCDKHLTNFLSVGKPIIVKRIRKPGTAKQYA